MGWNDLEYIMSLLRTGTNQRRVRCWMLVRIPKRRQTRQARSGVIRHRHMAGPHAAADSGPALSHASQNGLVLGHEKWLQDWR